MNGSPAGPGMAEAAVLDLERAQARPPGWRKKAKMERRRRAKKRASKLWEMEEGKWRRRELKFGDDMMRAVWRQGKGKQSAKGKRREEESVGELG